MPNDMSGPNGHLSTLRQMLHDHFNREELQVLCHDLGVRYDDLAGETLSGQVLSLVKYLERHNQIPSLIEQLQHLRPNVDWSSLVPAEPDAEPPFKGLQYFTEDDAHIFFGRETLTAELIEHLCQHRFLAVVGASGSGKSSVVRAGVVPAVRNGKVEFNGQNSLSWPIHVITPGDEPLKALAASLTRDTESVTAAATLMADMREDSQSLDLWLYRHLEGQENSRLVIVVDQFEELFTQCKDPDIRRSFVNNLVQAIQKGKQGRLTLILTLRADFYSHAVQHETLVPLLETRQRIVESMNATELGEAINGPAEAGEWQFQPGLVETILQDVGAAEGRQPEPGALPLLSHALLETWKRREGRVMTFAAYQSAGGVRRAIATTADNIYAQLAPSQQAIARSIFLRLTELGEGAQDTRRRALLDELVPQAESTAAVQAVLQRLTDARLITTEEAQAEVAHEALIREWPTLRQWLDEDREGLHIHRRITEAVKEWVRLDRDPGVLYRGTQLARALEWSQHQQDKLNLQEGEFLRASQEAVEAAEQRREMARQRELEQARELAQEQRRRAEEQTRATVRLRRLAAALAVIFLVAVAAAIFATGQQRVAVSNGQLANTREAEAIAAQGTAEAESRARTTEEARARENAQNAAAQATIAYNAQLTAEEERDRAEDERNRAEEQASLATSRQLAAQSLALLESQFDLALLLGLEAYEVDNTSEALSSVLSGLQASPALITTLRGHNSEVTGVAYTPDGQTLASGSWDGAVRLWDSSTGESIGQPLLGNTGALYSLAVDPDGTSLAAGGLNGNITLWDLTTDDPTARLLDGHNSAVNALAYSPDGQMLASGSTDHNVILWDVKSATPIDEPLTGHASRVLDVRFSSDGQTLATADSDGEIILWDINTREPIQTFERPLPAFTWELSSIALSPDGQFLAAGGSTPVIYLWDVSTGEPLGQLQGHAGGMLSLAFSPDGQTLASGTRDARIFLWEVNDWELIGAPLTGHTLSVHSMAFNPDGDILASASGDGTVILWDLEKKQSLGQPFGTGTKALTYSLDGQTIASGADESVVLWDVSTGPPTGRLLSGHTDRVYAIAFHPDGNMLASGDSDGTIFLWDVTAGESIEQLQGHAGRTRSLAFSPDGQMLASGGENNNIVLWEIGTTPPISSILTGHTSSVNSVAFSPDSQILASGSDDNRVFLWDVSGNESERRTLFGHTDSVNDVVFSPDGQTLASSGSDGVIIFWDVIDGSYAGRPLQGFTDWVGAMAFSPDGQSLASIGLDTTDESSQIFLWDVASGIQLGRPLDGHSDVAFSPDGKILTSFGSTDSVVLWDFDVESWHNDVCQKVKRNLTWVEWQQYLPGRPYRATCPDVPLDLGAGLLQTYFLALRGETEEALQNFEQLDQVIPLSLAEPLKEARAYALSGDWDGATAKLAQPMRALILAQAVEYALSDNLEEALKTMSQVTPYLPVELSNSLQESFFLLVVEGEGFQGLIEFALLMPIIQESNDPYLSGAICRYGSIIGVLQGFDLSPYFMPVCDQAVELSPDDGAILDSRGLARALSGDLQGAAKDFALFVEWATEMGGYEQYVGKRDFWISELEANRNPFDIGTLYDVVNE